METIEDFIMQYAKVRDQQKKYFQTRFFEDLKKSKRMENDLDNLCREYMKNKYNSKQTSIKF